MGFPRQEYWSGLPCPPLGDLTNPGIEPSFPYRRQILYHLSHQGNPSGLRHDQNSLLDWIAYRQPRVIGVQRASNADDRF